MVEVQEGYQGLLMTYGKMDRVLGAGLYHYNPCTQEIIRRSLKVRRGRGTGGPPPCAPWRGLGAVARYLNLDANRSRLGNRSAMLTPPFPPPPAYLSTTSRPDPRDRRVPPGDDHPRQRQRQDQRRGLLPRL